MKFNGMMAMTVTAVTTVTMVMLVSGVFGMSGAWAEDSAGQSALLEIDGKVHTVLIGEETKLKIGSKMRSVRIRIAPHSVFNRVGIRFRYPSSMGFNLDDSDPNVSIWSMDGDEAVIMVQQYNVDIDANVLYAAMKSEFVQMKAKVEVSAIQLKGKRRTLDGKRFKVKMGNVNILQDIYILQEGEQKLALFLQDTVTDNGKSSSEYIEILKLFSKSFEIVK